MPQLEVVVRHEVGLHARPAASFVRLAATFPCDITVRNVSKNGQEVDAKSILGVLTLGVNQGNTIAVEANGEQAEAALTAIRDLVENNFGE